MSDKTKQELWAERIEEFRARGMSQSAWCREHNLRPNQLGYWLRKLTNEANSPKTSRWISLDTIASAGSGVSLRIGNLVLEVQRGFDQQVLAEVVQALMDIC